MMVLGWVVPGELLMSIYAGRVIEGSFGGM